MIKIEKSREEVYMMEGYILLAEAIITRAAEDYLYLLAGFRLETTNCNIAEIECFFHSSYYEMMTDLDPEYLMERIKEKAAKMVLEYTVVKEKGSSRYYVCKVGDERTPLNRCYTTKKKALHEAAKLQGLDYKTYMKIRKRRTAPQKVPTADFCVGGHHGSALPVEEV